MSELFERLRKAWQTEKESEDLQIIGYEFFPDMTRYVAELNRVSFEDATLVDQISKKEKEYANHMLKHLSRMRLEKIVKSELNEKPLDSRALTPEEQTFHSNLRQVLSEFSSRIMLPKIDSATQPTVEAHEKPAQPIKQREKEEVELVVVRFLQPLPAIMGIDMRAYGPFKSEEIASIPQQNAVNLIRRGIAKLVEIEP